MRVSIADSCSSSGGPSQAAARDVVEDHGRAGGTGGLRTLVSAMESAAGMGWLELLKCLKREGSPE